MSIPLRQYWQLLSKYLQPQRLKVTLLFVLVLGSIVLQLAGPQVIAMFIDGALGDASASHLTMLAIAFMVVGVASQAVSVLSAYIGETVGWNATNALRTDLVAHCLGLDMSFHKTKTSGEMIQRVDGDVDALSSFFSQFVVVVLGNLLLLAGVLLMLFLEDWRLGLPMTVFALVALVVLMRLRQIAVPHWVQLRERLAQFFGFIGEHLSGREDIRGNGARYYTMNRMRGFQRELKPLYVRSELFGYGWMWLASHAIFTLGTAMALLISYLLWQDGALSLGSVYLAFQYTEMIRRPVEAIREQVRQLQSASAGVVRVQELFDRRSLLDDGGETPLPQTALSLSLRDVSFSYEEGQPVLQGVNVGLEPGEVLGLLGRTGSGKTTLGRLLVRLYDVDTGELRLGGVDIKQAPLADVRRRVGVVSQDVQLFEGSVRDNLTFFDASIEDSRIIEALSALGLADWLDSLSDGLDTAIGPGALSAGEAQLLACARIFLRDPGLVVLDEATSRLDPATQRLVDEAVGRLLSDRTAIIIAHRLATVDRADKIVILEDGVVVESGVRRALLAEDTSRYSQLRRLDREVQKT